MRVLLILIIMSLNIFAEGMLESSYSCVEEITDISHVSIDQKIVMSKKKKAIWLAEDTIIMQGEERATLFPLKLAKGLNLVSLANAKGRELETVCVYKSSSVMYIDSIGKNCLNRTKHNYYQSISYAQENFESNDLLGNKIYIGLNKIRKSFNDNVNRHLCEDYIKTLRKCYSSFSKLRGKNSIPLTETRYRFVLKELGKTLHSQCQKA